MKGLITLTYAITLALAIVAPSITTIAIAIILNIILAFDLYELVRKYNGAYCMIIAHVSMVALTICMPSAFVITLTSLYMLAMLYFVMMTPERN